MCAINKKKWWLCFVWQFFFDDKTPINTDCVFFLLTKHCKTQNKFTKFHPHKKNNAFEFIKNICVHKCMFTKCNQWKQTDKPNGNYLCTDRCEAVSWFPFVAFLYLINSFGKLMLICYVCIIHVLGLFCCCFFFVVVLCKFRVYFFVFFFVFFYKTKSQGQKICKHFTPLTFKRLNKVKTKRKFQIFNSDRKRSVRKNSFS